jgi:hypothetical protein
VLVIFLGPIVLTIAVLLLGFVIALLLAWAPLIFRVATASVLSGTAGAITVAAFSYWIFGLLAHEGLESWSPLIACAIALFIPFLNDRRKGKERGAAAADYSDRLRSETKAARLQLPLQTAGYAIGFVLVSVWLLIRSAA